MSQQELATRPIELVAEIGLGAAGVDTHTGLQ